MQNVEIGKASLRSYALYYPGGSSTPPEHACPLVIMLHGAGSSGPEAAFETGWCDKADKEKFVVIFPNAEPADPTQPLNFRTNQRVWSDLSGRFRSHAVDDSTFLSTVIDDVIARGGIDMSRVYITGFSNGASAAFLASAQLSRRIAAVAPVAGSCWFRAGKNPVEPEDSAGTWGPAAALGSELARGVPTLYLTGGADPLNPLAGGVLQFANGSHVGFGGRAKPPLAMTLHRWALAIGANDQPQDISCPPCLSAAPPPLTQPGLPPLAPAWLAPILAAAPDGALHAQLMPPQQGRTEPAGLLALTITGLGHVWPGGRTPYPPSTVGASSATLRATDVIWAFFQGCALKEAPLPDTGGGVDSAAAGVAAAAPTPVPGPTGAPPTPAGKSVEPSSVDWRMPDTPFTRGHESSVPPEELQRSKRAVKTFYRAQSARVDAYLAHRAMLTRRDAGLAADNAESEAAAASSEARRIRTIIRVAFALNVLLFLFKIVAAAYSRSLAVIGSAIDSSMDVFSGAILFCASWLASKRDRLRFPIGKARMEPLGVVVFACVMSMAALQLLVESATSIASGVADGPAEIVIDALPLAALVTAVVIKVGVFIAAWPLRGASDTIAALILDARNDMITNAAAVAAVIIASRRREAWWVDPAFAMALGVMIIVTWSMTIKEFVYALSGETADPATLSQLIYLAANHDPRITHVESLLAYHVGSNLLVEADVVLPRHLSLHEAHDIGESLQQTFETLPFVERAFVHLDWDSAHTVVEHAIV